MAALSLEPLVGCSLSLVPFLFAMFVFLKAGRGKFLEDLKEKFRELRRQEEKMIKAVESAESVEWAEPASCAG